jgi:hypothetical protein
LPLSRKLTPGFFRKRATLFLMASRPPSDRLRYRERFPWSGKQAWTVGADPAAVPEVARVAANVTGANRLLIGVGWSMVAVVFWLKQRRELVLTQELSLEFTILMVATLLTFLIFFLQSVPRICPPFSLACIFFTSGSAPGCPAMRATSSASQRLLAGSP